MASRTPPALTRHIDTISSPTGTRNPHAASRFPLSDASSSGPIKWWETTQKLSILTLPTSGRILWPRPHQLFVMLSRFAVTYHKELTAAGIMLWLT